MSEQFYEKALNLFSGFLMIFLLVTAATMNLLLYVSTQKTVFFVSYYALIIGFSIFFIIFIRKLKEFKENVYLLIPHPQKPETLEAMPIDLSDMQCLQICTLYRNGIGYTEICQTLQLKHHQTVRRGIMKGLDILLKAYKGGETHE